MKISRDIKELREQVSVWRKAGESLALVPTMGNLHDGHLSLVEMAKSQAGRVVVSIFINPMQFDHAEEVDRYPRTFQADCEKLVNLGVDLLVLPTVQSIYPKGVENTARVDLPGMTQLLCGAYRPGHFAGVLTVVSKLFNLLQPDVAIFGEKDYQQLLVIREMVEDLNYPIKILSGETIRETDGLAMSSRNNYLSLEERELAPILYRVLQKTAQRLIQGERDFDYLEQSAKAELQTNGLEPDYVSILSAHGLQAVDNVAVEDMVVLAAAWLGSARLIDNLPLHYLVKAEQQLGSG